MQGLAHKRSNESRNQRHDSLLTFLHRKPEVDRLIIEWNEDAEEEDKQIIERQDIPGRDLLPWPLPEVDQRRLPDRRQCLISFRNYVDPRTLKKRQEIRSAVSSDSFSIGCP
jgi:hypothetical protein